MVVKTQTCLNENRFMYEMAIVFSCLGGRVLR